MSGCRTASASRPTDGGSITPTRRSSRSWSTTSTTTATSMRRAAKCSLASRAACPTASRWTPKAACGSRCMAAAGSSASHPMARPIGPSRSRRSRDEPRVLGPRAVRSHRRHRGQHCSSGAGGHDLPGAGGRGRCSRSAGAARSRLTSDHEHPPAARRGGAERSSRERSSRHDFVDLTPSPAAPGASGLCQRRTAQSCSTRCALTRRLPRCTSRRTRAFVIPNGGFATTWKSRRGRRRSAASASTTTMSSPNSARRLGRSPGMQLDGDDACAGLDERARERAPNRRRRRRRDRRGRAARQRRAAAPSGDRADAIPRCPWRGHGGGGPSRRSSSWQASSLGRVSRRF